MQLNQEEFKVLMDEAKIFEASKFFTYTDKKNVHPLDKYQIYTLMRLGLDLGIGPTRALTGFDILYGKPAPSSELLKHLVDISGGYVRIVASDPDAVQVEYRAVNWPAPSRLTITMKEADAAGWRRGAMWASIPQRMLEWRAIAAAARLCGAGGVYTEDELGVDHDEPEPVARIEAKPEIESKPEEKPETEAKPEVEEKPETEAKPDVSPKPATTEPPARNTMPSPGNLSTAEYAEVVKEHAQEASDRSKLEYEFKKDVKHLAELHTMTVGEVMTIVKTESGAVDPSGALLMGDAIPLDVLRKMAQRVKERIEGIEKSSK